MFATGIATAAVWRKLSVTVCGAVCIFHGEWNGWMGYDMCIAHGEWEGEVKYNMCIAHREWLGRMGYDVCIAHEE